MRFIAIGILFTILTGCSDSTRDDRGYVISHVIDDPMVMEQEP